jgi:hypothetical protein
MDRELTLTFLVFDQGKLVAAFAERSDANAFVEQCGNARMEIRRGRV